MFTNRHIRQLARQTINATPGSYLLAIIPVVLSLVIRFFNSSSQDLEALSTIASNTSKSTAYLINGSVFQILYQLLITLLFLSISLTFFQIIFKQKERTGFKDGFQIFNNHHFGKIIWAAIVKGFFLFLWGLIFFVGLGLLVGAFVFAVIIVISAQVTSADQLPQSVLAVIGLLFLIGLLLTAAGLVLYLPQYYAYSQVEFILFEQLDKEEYHGAFALLKESRQLMKGFKGQRFVLDLSFIGWFILVGLSFGLVGIYVYPYYSAAQVHFFKQLKDVKQALGEY